MENLEYNTHVYFDDIEGLDEKKKRMMEQLVEQRARDLTNVCIAYRPDCGCEIEQFVVLDRYPMSPKIRSACPVCKKGCLMEISEPPLFHTEIGGDFTLEELTKSFISDSWQKEWLHLYKLQAILSED
jgi:hypothetical protein